MIKKLNKKHKLPSMSLVEYWYLSLKKDIKVKKLNYFLSNKNLKKNNSFNKLTYKKLSIVKRSLNLFKSRKLIFSLNKKLLYRNFKIWINKKYRRVFLKNKNYNFLKIFIFKKFRKYINKIYLKKLNNYKSFFSYFVKNKNYVKIYNRLFYLNNLYIFSKFLSFNTVFKTKFKLFSLLKTMNFLKFNSFKKFKKFSVKKFKLKFLIKWWYFLRLKLLRIKNLRIINSFIKIKNSNFLINTKFNLVSTKNFNKFFNKFIGSLRLISSSFFVNLKFQLTNLKKKNNIYYYYFLGILKFYIRSFYKKPYLFYSFILYLISISFTNLINLFNLKVNLFLTNKFTFIKKPIKNKSKFTFNRFFEKEQKFLNLRISKNKLFKFILFFNNSRVNLKKNFKFIKKFNSFFLNAKLNFNQVKVNKLYSFKSYLLSKRDYLYQQEIFDYNLNNIFFDNNLLFFENKVKNYYLYIFILFFEFKLNFNNSYSNLTFFIKDMSLFFSNFRFKNLDKLFFKFLLKDKNLLQILMISFNNFNILFNFILKLLVKKFLLMLKNLKLTKRYFLNYKIKNIFNKLTWKSNLSIKNIINKNIFSMHKFYINYMSLSKFVQVERIKLVEGYYKIKNIFNFYKHVNPVKTLIVSDTSDRKLFCLIWNIWESFFFYRDVLINFCNEFLLQKRNTFKLQNKLVSRSLKKRFDIISIFLKKKFDKKDKRREISFDEKIFSYKSNKLVSRYFVRKKFSFFNMLFFWYLFYFNKLFFWIKIVLFRVWLEKYFIIYKFDNKFFDIFSLDQYKLNISKNLQIRLFNFNLLLRNYFIDYYRSINIFNTFFFKSISEFSLIHLSFVSIYTNRKFENKNFSNFYLNFFKF